MSLIFVAFFDPAPDGFQPRKGDRKLALQRAFGSQTQIRLANNLRSGTVEIRRGHPSAAILVELQPRRARFRPGQHAKRRER